MRFLAAPVFAALLFTLPAHAQTTPATASSIVSPSLDGLRQSLRGLRLDKWKAPGPVREETNGNIGSITRDLDGTLPGLLSTADAAPGVVSKNLPVFRNIDALYDVLLRVVETADLAAPENETETLHNALASLEDARRSLGDALQSAALTNEQQLTALRQQARAQPAPAAQGTTVVDDGAVKPATAKHKKAVAKPAPAQSSPQ